MAAIEVLAPVENGAAEQIEFTEPYVARVLVEGAAPYLFHRWNNESVAEKAKAAKGSKAKKEDDIESYVYRLSDGTLAAPAEHFRMALVNAARYRQDPRSPRKSAMDLFKAGIAPLEEMFSLGQQTWDYLDQRRVSVQRNGITRSRPALMKGWRCEVELAVLTPEYISPQVLNEVFQMAGRLIGVGDFRPTYGRFQVIHFETAES